MKKKILLFVLVAAMALGLAACTLQAPKLDIETVAITSITVKAVDGAEYSKDGGETWQDSNVLDQLTAETEYTVAIRLKKTASKEASPSSSKTVTTLAKEAQTAPTLTVESTATTITANEVLGAEYCINDGEWQTGATFIGLTPETSYTVYIRMAETDTKKASDPASQVISTIAAVVLDAPANFAKSDTLLTWDAVEHANQYFVVVNLAPLPPLDDNYPPPAPPLPYTPFTFVSGLTFPYMIETAETRLAISKLPFNTKLVLTVVAGNTSAEYATSAPSAEQHELDRGSLFNMTHTKFDAEMLNNGNFRVFTEVQFNTDIVVAPVSQEMTEEMTSEALDIYHKLVRGTDEEVNAASELIGNDIVFLYYDETLDIEEYKMSGESATGFRGRCKFMPGYIHEFDPATGHDNGKVKGESQIIGFVGHTFTTNFYYVNSQIWTAEQVAELAGKTIVLEVGISLNGVYYGYRDYFHIPAAV